MVKNLPDNAGDSGEVGSVPGKMPWRRKWQPTPVFLPGKFHGQKSLAGCSPWDHKESDIAGQLSMHMHTSAPTVECRLYLTDAHTEVCVESWRTEPFVWITLAQQRELPSFPAWGGAYVVL